MHQGSYKIFKNKVILTIRDRICETPKELLVSDLFQTILDRYLKYLSEKNSNLLDIFENKTISDKNTDILVRSFQYLVKLPISLLPNLIPESHRLLEKKEVLDEFVEGLYNFWREFDRFIICDSEGDALDERPYRTFNDTIEKLTFIIRSVYRDIRENITVTHPNIYRQIRAGAEFAVIALPETNRFQNPVYKPLNNISVITQLLLNPPLILDTPMNKRSGKFIKIDKNPLELVKLDPSEWLCYPAKVGDLLIYVYLHESFYELGFSLCNLFSLAEKNECDRVPDAIYLFGVESESLKPLNVNPTVFYDDEENNILVGAVPNDPQFGYFGYLKKMILTLHNIKIMKKGRLPFHGALTNIIIKGGIEANILMMGDSGAGKSETLEAFRILGDKYIQDLTVIADDMGSIDIGNDNKIMGYGTEIGAFLRLDDLQPGFAFGQMDRAIIMNAGQTNARIILPVTSFYHTVTGVPINFILYANNYEKVDDEHPILERFSNPEDALKTFAEGKVMSKGTTSTTGIVQNYFANVFGPVQYQDMHQELAKKYFKAFIERGVFVGQIRTQLGIHGFERDGPKIAAEMLLKSLMDKK